LGKAIILVPSPHVAEDHQTKNAMNLVEKEAAVLVTDSEAREKLLSSAEALLKDAKTQSQLRENIIKLAKPNATSEIVDEIEQLIGSKN